jgi:hypothetical protein
MRHAGLLAVYAAAVLIAGCAAAPREAPAPSQSPAPREDGGIVGTGNRSDCEAQPKEGARRRDDCQPLQR